MKGANFCRARLCPLCNWRRSLKLRHQLSQVLNAVFVQDDSLRMLLLTLTEPNSSWDDFGLAIGRLIGAIAKLMRYKRVRAAVRCPRPGEFHPHFHVLLVVPGAYLEPDSPLYITQAEWVAMWRKALGADGRRIIDIRVTENSGEVATRPLLRLDDARQLKAEIMLLGLRHTASYGTDAKWQECAITGSQQHGQSRLCIMRCTRTRC